jgi:hypothetical protein
MYEFETPGEVRVRVAVPSGEVTLETGTPGTVEVEVTALRGDEASLRAAEETRVELHERRGRYEVVVEAPKRRGGFLSREAQLGVRVLCPDGADFELSTASADLDARGRLGAVVVKSASGDTAVVACASLSVTSASGDVEARDVAGELAVKTASGDIEIGTVGGPATVNAVSGDVRLARAGGLLTLNSVSGDVAVETFAGEGLRANTVSGDLIVDVVPGLRLWIDAQSVSGSMTSSLDLGDEPPAGDDEPVVELRARSVSGDVQIGRAPAARAE